MCIDREVCWQLWEGDVVWGGTGQEAIAVSGGGVTRQRGKVRDVTHKHPR